jgi:hypothetical protein
VIAQDTPAVEIFGGYSYMRIESSGPDTLRMNGWNAALAVNANKWAGFVADFGGLYNGDFDGIDVKAHSFMFGPRVTIRKGRVVPFVQALFGFTKGKGTDNETGAEFWNESDFSMSFGGGLDINVNNRLAIRPIQLEYFGIKEGGEEFSNNLRYSAGIVFKLGKR